MSEQETIECYVRKTGRTGELGPETTETIYDPRTHKAIVLTSKPDIPKRKESVTVEDVSERPLRQRQLIEGGTLREINSRTFYKIIELEAKRQSYAHIKSEAERNEKTASEAQQFAAWKLFESPVHTHSAYQKP